MSFRRTFMDDLRGQLAAETESPAVGRMRFYTAGLSIVFGIAGISGFFSMLRGDVSWAAAPGFALMLAGGVLATLSWRTADVAASRRYGLGAAACTVIGFIGFFLVSMFTD